MFDKVTQSVNEIAILRQKCIFATREFMNCFNDPTKSTREIDAVNVIYKAAESNYHNAIFKEMHYVT